MIHIDPTKNTDRENNKLLIGSVLPRPIAFVTSETNGVLNGAPFSYFNVVNSTPPLISLSIRRDSGKVKDTARNIFESKEFVVHIVDRTNVEKVNQTSASFPSEVSEVDQVGLTPVASSVIAVRGVKEAKVRMECILFDSLTIKEDGEPVSDLIIGKVVAYHVDDAVYDDGKIDLRKLDPMSRLAGPNYGTVGEVLTYKRPE